MTRILFAFLCLSMAQPVAAEMFIVQDGQPRAEIVISREPPRMTLLAARELQTYVEKISGARLRIVTDPSADAPVKVCVGRSSFTDRLGISADGLKHGAYRIVSGDDWLVLIGDDTDFTPMEPWPHKDSEWDKITGATWGNMMPMLIVDYTGRPRDIGKPPSESERLDTGDTIPFWAFDERGSFNAVCGLLRRLGVRWYLPGELGEIVPAMESIPLPRVDKVVRPDFPVRQFNFRYRVHGRDLAMWAMRLGLRDSYSLQISHGMDWITRRSEIRENHPEWFALYNGKRDNLSPKKCHQLCYSNEDLFQETVRYVRTLFDRCGFDVVSVMPPDGYTAMCQCPLCEGKDTPERGSRGYLSDHVWEFVNRAAEEVKKSHSNKMVSCVVYSSYTLPPEKIDKLESNVLVFVGGGRRPEKSRPEQQEEVRQLREAWVAKTDNPIMIGDNYPYTARGWYLPNYVPHVLGDGINACKGISRGESIHLSIRPDFNGEGGGFNHFLIYFTARMYWGGTQQSVDRLFDEYCRLFYGPAESEMKAFFEYCEAHWQEMEREKSTIDAALELFAAAQGAVDAGSVYGKRIALVDDYLEGLRKKGQQLARPRGRVPQLRLARQAEGITIDGRLDEAYWQRVQGLSGHLRELHTGRKPVSGTTFQVAWGKDRNLYFAVRCEERPGEPLNIATTRDEDSAIWDGDLVEVLLETESHSYYQIVVNPSGAMADLDGGAPKRGAFDWDSQAEAATQVADGYWTAEIRIPVTQDDSDPLHQVIGRKPTVSLPWHFNVCRQRVRDHGVERSAFSPTGANSFHELSKFGRLYDGRPHEFPFDASEPDYLSARAAATDLMKERKREEAIVAFMGLAERDVSDLQKADALEQAALCAAGLGQFDRAMELADAIPIEAVAKCVRMRGLWGKRMPQELVEQYRDEDISRWPFWMAGDGYYLRGRAFALTGSGKEAETDLVKVLEFITDKHTRQEVWLALGANRESRLKDTAAALEAYQKIIASSDEDAGPTYCRAVQQAARILRDSRRADEALAVLRKVNIDELRGVWRSNMLVTVGETQIAAGRTDEALVTYREVLADTIARAADKRAAEIAIDAITNDQK